MRTISFSLFLEIMFILSILAPFFLLNVER